MLASESARIEDSPLHATLPFAEPHHRAELAADARAQIAFFRASLNPTGGFDLLDGASVPIADHPQELHATTRMVHSYALAHAWGTPDCAAVLDAGMSALWTRHRDADEGGYVWSFKDAGWADTTKLAYGHVFVLLAASSALAVGHDDAPRLMDDISMVIEARFWDETAGRLREEYRKDWSAFSTYRGMNANMHGAEAFLGAYEATGQEVWLDRAGRILGFFVGEMAAANGWRIPEHYTEDWQVDPAYRGNPMFRPAGTTPGHALEFARLLLQHWDLSGRRNPAAPAQARALIETALTDAWLDGGGLAYTLYPSGKVDVADRYWWPVTEGLGALAALMKVEARPSDIEWYWRLWTFAKAHFIDSQRGGWFPEIDASGQPTGRQFVGKPDIYHSLQAVLFPLCPHLSGLFDDLRALPPQGEGLA
jgi:sulfoquinovose isomerase